MCIYVNQHSFVSGFLGNMHCSWGNIQEIICTITQKVLPYKRATSVQATYVSYKINWSLHLEAWFPSVLSLFYFKDYKDVPTITSCRLSELHWTEPRQHSRDQSQSLVAALKVHFAPRSLTAVTLQTELCGSWASKLGPLSLNEISCDRQEGQKKKKKAMKADWGAILNSLTLMCIQRNCCNECNLCGVN